uniref:Bardet-Biedl syndrome 1 protein isoform 2 n=1 Tax=Haemonchus contortus TaxID=6289 RepID=W6NDG1_HAECO
MAMPDTVKWMSALSDEQAGVFTFAHCVCLSDMYGDGDTKLVLAHVGSSRFNMRLKVFKGVTVVGESALGDMPTAVVSFYNEKISPKELTPLSQTLLVTKAEDRPAFIDYYAIPKYVNNLQNPAFQIIADCRIPGVPVQIVTYGVFDIDYRIFVSNRDGQIFSIKRDQTVKEKPIITCKTHIVGFTRINKMISGILTNSVEASGLRMADNADECCKAKDGKPVGWVDDGLTHIWHEAVVG